MVLMPAKTVYFGNRSIQGNDLMQESPTKQPLGF